MPKGVLVAHQADANGRPTFVTGGRLNKWFTSIPNRLHYYLMDGEDDPEAVVHFKQCRNAANGTLEIGAQNLKVYIVWCQGVRVERARRILKWLRTNSTVQTLAELRADARPVADTVRASPDLIRPLTHDPTDGSILTSDTYAMATIFGQDSGSIYEGTTAAEVDGATEETW